VIAAGTDGAEARPDVKFTALESQFL